MRTIWLVFLGSLVSLGLAAQDFDTRARALGLRFGTALETAWTADANLASVIKGRFGVATPTEAIDADGPEDWATWVATVRAWNLDYRGARIAGAAQPARWATLSPAALDQEFTLRLRRLVDQSASVRPLSWDVVADQFEADGRVRATPLTTVWGPEAAARALKLAAGVDPKTPLFLAEAGTLGLNPRSDALYRLATALKTQGIPLAGVALGGRQRVAYRDSAASVAANLHRFAALGLAIHVVDWDFGQKEDRQAVGRGSLRGSPQAQAYEETLTALLSVPAVTLIAVAEPTDSQKRSVQPSPPYASPALLGAGGLLKEAASAVLARLGEGRPMGGIPLLAPPVDEPRADEVWRRIPASTADLRSLENRRRATYFLPTSPPQPDPAPEDFSVVWYLAWTGSGLELALERTDDRFQAGQRLEAFEIGLRGPGFQWAGSVPVGEAWTDGTLTVAWASDGRTGRLLWAVPDDAGWGPGTRFLFRLSATDVDPGAGTVATVATWPADAQGRLPWKRLEIAGRSD